MKSSHDASPERASTPASGAGAADFAARFWHSNAVVSDLSPELTRDTVDADAFRLLADNIPTLCWIAAGDGYIAWYNRRWHEYCGTTPQQMEGWGWQSVHDPARLPAVMTRWTRSIATGEPFEMTFPLRGADGIFRPFLTRIQPVRDPSGRIVRWFGVNTEVSERHAAEVALRAERDRSRGVLDNMSEGFVLLDPAFRVVDINPEGVRLDGRARTEIVGRSHWELWPGSEHSEIGALYRRAMARRESASLEHHYTWADGRSAWVDMRAFPSGDGLAVFYRDVTDRKFAEASLLRSEDHYRNVVELNPQIVWTAGADGLLDRVAERWHDWTGFSGLGTSWGAALHPDDLQTTTARWAHSLATGDAYDVEHRVRMRDGSYRWMHSRAFPRHDGDGAIIKWYGTTQDVNERKVAEVELAASEARFRSVAETMPGFVWTADHAGQLTYTSPNWHTYSGSAPEASNGGGWAGFVHPDDQASVFGRWADSIATLAPYEVEFRLRRADGHYRWWLARARPSLGPARDATHWIGTCTDLDDIIEARETLARFRERLEQLVEERTLERDRIWRLIPDLLMTGTLAGRVLSVNPAWVQALGYDEATLLAAPFWQLVHPEHLDDWAAAVTEMRAGRSARHQNRMRTATGEYRWFDWVGTPVGDTFYAVARDITEQKERMAELDAAQHALRQSQKMEAVGQLTGGIAHDFNNMLAVVMVSLDMLTRTLPAADARARRHVDAAQKSTRRAALLTQRLLAFSRRQPLQPESVDVNRLVAGMSDLLRRSLGADVRLETVLGEPLWPTHVDTNQLESVILNLSVNARDAMTDGGQLTIETRNVHVAAPGDAANGLPPGDYVRLDVSDTGTGMPEHVIAKAFDPFFTTKEVGKGTGLGLSQVYGFLKQSGGHVRISSTLGRGTTIEIHLPRHSGGETGAALAPDDTGAVQRASRGELVLVVDDEPAIRQLSVEALDELGYRTLSADSAAQALTLLDLHPDIALLFTDIVMPGPNGTLLAEAARARYPALRLLFTTGYARDALLLGSAAASGVEVLGKPFSVEQLAAKVRAVLDGPPPRPTA